MQVKDINGVRLQNLKKKRVLFKKREGEPRYAPQGIDMSLESIRHKIMSRRKKRKDKFTSSYIKF